VVALRELLGQLEALQVASACGAWLDVGAAGEEPASFMGQSDDRGAAVVG
jgi:hypothetical protein